MISYRKILIIEDNFEVRKVLVNIFVNNGYVTHEASKVSSSIHVLKTNDIDLILLDLELEDGSGLDVLKFVRRQNHSIPILIISNISAIDIKLCCFREGTDDYITKPFNTDEVLYRVDRALNRTEHYSKNIKIKSNVVFGDFAINYDDGLIYIMDNKVKLRKKLFNILVYFINNENKVIHKETLYAKFWKDCFNFDENTLSVHIHQLRRVIDLGVKPSYIETIHGVGYIFRSKK